MAHAKYCYKNYPTIYNAIPKQANTYNNTLESYALIDNRLAEAQLAIGESSNIAQLSLTYSYNFNDKKYQDNTCILSVVAQIAIDNAKRSYDIDLNKEIERLKNDLDIENNGLPYFWQITKKDKRKARSNEERKKRQKANKEKIKAKINSKLICPMNYLYDIQLIKFRNQDSTIPIGEFFINHIQDNNRRKSKKVEELIEKYSIDLYHFHMDNNGINWIDNDDADIMMMNFEQLISDIQSICISCNYLGLMSWLINRAFSIGAGVRRNELDSTLEKNKSLLLKVLYTVNKKAFLQCFREQLIEKDI